MHEHAAKAVPLITGKHANLRGVAYARGDFTGEHSCDQFVAAGLAQNKRRARDELAATGEQNNVLEEAQSSGAAAVLIVDLAIDMIRVGQVDKFRSRLEEAIVPPVKAHASGDAGVGF